MDNSTDEKSMPLLTRIVALFLRGDVALLFIVVSLALGAAALFLTPREEEPQIVVPMADIFVEAPGLSAEEVERQVTERLEKLVYQIDGVEYVYSMSQTDRSIVTVRFYVGEDREDSLIKLHAKIAANVDQVPPSVKSWAVKPVEIDDVPIVIATLWSDQPNRYSGYELRRVAEELQHELQAIPNTNRVAITGGRPRQVRVELDAQRLAARGTSPLQVAEALQVSNTGLSAGQFDQQNQVFLVDGGVFFRDVSELRQLVVQTIDDRPVYLRDVATVIDGPAEIETYSWIGFGPAAEEGARRGEMLPAVHLTVAKRKGANAVRVARNVEQRLADLAGDAIPDGIHYRITRDYGETANNKVNELVEALVVAVLTVIGLIGLVIGWRAAVVVALAIPVCYSLTLFVNLLVGYTINRVTMFALILSLGLLVDDPITDVENIARYFSMRKFKPRLAVLRAVQEVRPALILSTLAIIASFLPLAFITGMMGPYMAPMALNVPLTVTVSTVVAFLVTPWLSMAALRRAVHVTGEGPAYDLTSRPLYRITQFLLRPVLSRPGLPWLVLLAVALLMALTVVLPAQRLVPLKMLPYDNKNEFQLVIDMPEGTTLDQTNRVTRSIGNFLATIAEVRDFEIFVGMASPMDFNGLVRHYFLRSRPHEAEVRVNLVDKDRRQQQSHEIVLRIRREVAALSEAAAANVKLVEVPPGPPVLATVTAEVYGPSTASPDGLLAASRAVAARLRVEPGIVDVDTSGEADQTKWVFETDKPKAALSGISTETVVDTLATALGGSEPTVVHLPYEVNPLVVKLRLPRAERSAIDDLAELYVRGDEGQLVQLGGIGRFVEKVADKTIYHKNLRRVAFVYGEVAGRPPSDAIIDIMLDRHDATAMPTPIPAGDPPLAEDRSWFSPGGGQPWSLPEGYYVEWAGEGEWKITLDVFRDLGLAFAAALFAIFVILMFQTGSRLLPLIIMLAIPLTLIGICPGFWLLNLVGNRTIDGYANPVFFTATAMIGIIALAGIVVRNSVVLVDFIHLALDEGLELSEAIIQSVAVRTRPILLTAGTTLLGNWVITLDPVFSGLAWAIIFGILTSTIFTLVVIPIVYWLIYRRTAASPSSATISRA